MLLGYARVSTDEQETHLQIDALKTAGCERVFQEKASGAESGPTRTPIPAHCGQRSGDCGQFLMRV